MYTFCSIWPAGLCSSVTLWASHLTSNTRCSLKPGLLPLLSLTPAPNSPRVSSPLFSPLCQPRFLSENCECVCVCVLGLQGLNQWGNPAPFQDDLVLAERVIHSFPFINSTALHHTFFFFTSVHTSSKPNLLMFHLHDWELVSAARLDLKNQTLYHKHRKQKHVCMFHRVVLFRIF